MPEQKTASPFAILGIFHSVDDLMAAIPVIRAKNLGRLEAYTPYPVHGLGEALGLRRSPLGGMVLVMGILGALTAFGFQFWASAVDYPIVTGGKAPWSWEAFVPIMFEAMVAFATFTAGFGMLFLLNQLPFFGHPMLGSNAIRAVTRDRFALAIEAEPGKDGALDVSSARETLVALSATDIEVLERPQPGPFLSATFVLRAMGGIFIACVVAGIGTYWAIKLMPRLIPVSYMLEQPRVNAQQAFGLGAQQVLSSGAQPSLSLKVQRFLGLKAKATDGVPSQQPAVLGGDLRAMQVPVPGTVARGYLPLQKFTQEEAVKLVNPLSRTREVLALGKQAFQTRCLVCHGPLANGIASLGTAYGGKPANLQAPQFLDQVIQSGLAVPSEMPKKMATPEPGISPVALQKTPEKILDPRYLDGKLFWTLQNGKNAMPSQAAFLSIEEAWAVVHYVRALQRAQNAKDEDLP